MKALKYVLYAIGGLIVLLVVVIGIVAATFDPNAYKPQIVQMVKEKTGRTLAIQGDIGLKIFPKIGAAVGKTTLSERDSDKEFAGVDAVQVYLALLPLLSKQVVVDEVRIDGLRANLIKLNDGKTNFSDLAGGGARAVEKSEVPKPAAAPRDSPPPQQAVKLDINGIRVTRSRVTWRDETNGNDLAVEVAQLKTGRLADRTPSPVELDVTVKGAKPKADLQAKLTGTLTFDLQAQEYSFKGLNAKLSGSALDFSGIAATLKADIEAAGATQAVKLTGLNLDAKASRGKDNFDVKLTAPSIQSGPEALAVDALALSATGTVAGMTLTESSLKAPKLRVNLAANQVLVEGLALLAKGKMGQDQLDIDLTMPKLEVSGDKASGESVVLTAKLAGAERNADVSLKLAALEGSAKALKIAALNLAVDAKVKDDTVKGTLSTPIAGNLEARIFELPKIAADFTVAGPSIAQKTMKVVLAGAVRADLGKERVAGDILAKLDESNIKAKLGMTKFSAPAYDFDVNIDKLNVDRYMAPKQKGVEGKPAAAGTARVKARRFSQTCAAGTADRLVAVEAAEARRQREDRRAGGQQYQVQQRARGCARQGRQARRESDAGEFVSGLAQGQRQCQCQHEPDRGEADADGCLHRSAVARRDAEGPARRQGQCRAGLDHCRQHRDRLQESAQRHRSPQSEGRRHQRHRSGRCGAEPQGQARHG